MISVVIPVYNVKDYLDRCVESVVNQTFRDIEIILINDGSTDGSDEKCIEWSKRDSRIIYVSKKNEGLGPTRNFGIRIAKYDYIAFLDSDDWWDLTMLEKMYKCAADENSDMVICDRYDVFIDPENGEMELQIIKLPIMFEDKIDNEVMDSTRIVQIVGNSAWGRLYRRSLFIDNNIYMPNVYCEDAAIMSYLTTFCKVISCIKEPLYYYLQKRKGSILNTMDAAKTMINCLEHVRKQFSNSGKMQKYYDSVKWLAYDFTIGTTRTTANLLTDENKTTRDDIINGLTEFLNQYYPDNFNKRYIIGSYNLRRSIGFGLPMLEDKRCHYMNISIISMFSPAIQLDLWHKDGLRKFWINADMKKTVMETIDNQEEDYIFIDFLEERFDIAYCRGSYFTLSEAFMDIKDEFPYEYKQLSRFDEKVNELWKEKCDEFIEYLKSNFKTSKIVLVKMYLSPYYGAYRKENKFDDIENINKINNLLSFYYDYFIRRMEGIHVVECDNMNTFFTDMAFKFGVYPYHLNEGFFIALGEKLKNIVTSGKAD